MLENFNHSSASNPNANAASWPQPAGVPVTAVNSTGHAMSQGMVLVLSQWGGFSKLATWLNGECSAPYSPCVLPADNQEMRIWDLELL